MALIDIVELLAIPITFFLVCGWIYFTFSHKKYWSLILSFIGLIAGGLIGIAFSVIIAGMLAVFYWVTLPFFIIFFGVLGAAIGNIIDNKKAKDF